MLLESRFLSKGLSSNLKTGGVKTGEDIPGARSQDILLIEG